MILPASYSNGFAPRDGSPLYPELWRGCVGAWNPGLGPSGLTLRDNSGLNRHGTLTNGPTWAANQGRYAIQTNGTSSYVSCGQSLLFDKNKPFFVSVWCLGQPVVGAWKRLTTAGWLLLPVATNKIGFGILSAPGGGNWRYTTTTFDPSKMNHFCGVWDGTNTVGGSFVYFNGVRQTSYTTVESIDTTPDATADFRIGATDGTTSYTAGTYAELLIISGRMPTENQIRALASRPGIAYELAPRRRSSSAVQFNRRRRLLLGAS